jgi:hypothetical protein
MWMESLATYFKVLSQHSHGGNKENNKKTSVKIESRFEPMYEAGSERYVR